MGLGLSYVARQIAERRETLAPRGLARGMLLSPPKCSGFEDNLTCYLPRSNVKIAVLPQESEGRRRWINRIARELNPVDR
jgi:hypothetical protein